MNSRLIHIIILFLVLFQSAWAMEQTYRSLCDSFETDQSLEHEKDNDNHSSQNSTSTEHQHHCNHVGTHVVGIVQISIDVDIVLNHFYPEVRVKQPHSITKQPAIPPPIV